MRNRVQVKWPCDGSRGWAIHVGDALDTLRKAEVSQERREQLARYQPHDFAAAARSVREGVREMFTWQRFRLPVPFTKCLAAANIVESPQGEVQKKRQAVTRWRAAETVERGVAWKWLLTAYRFRRIGGKLDLWALAAVLGPACAATEAETDRVA